MVEQTEAASPDLQHGIGYWMRRVLIEHERTCSQAGEEAVHDLRVAIRRCRSMGAELSDLDPHPVWKKMEGEGKRLFQRLGSLRDMQVSVLWLQQLSPSEDPVRLALEDLLARRETQEESRAQKALKKFPRKKWLKWSSLLEERAARIPEEGLALQHQALKRWEDAYALHRLAVRDRTKVGYHRLRIGLKKFRYTVENFLPSRYAKWGKDLKKIQDSLGDLHDLDVLWTTLPQAGLPFGLEARRRWSTWIEPVRRKKLQYYRRRMVGSRSLWTVWRADLPRQDQLDETGLAKLQVWASFVDPKFEERQSGTALVVQLFEALARAGLTADLLPAAGKLLKAASLLRSVDGSGKKSAKQAYQTIGSLAPPLGWSSSEMELIAQIVRYSRPGTRLPRHKSFVSLTAQTQRTVLFLAGVVQLCEAFETSRSSEVVELEVEVTPDSIILWTHAAEHPNQLFFALAENKALLEWASNRPIIPRPPQETSSLQERPD